MALFYGQVESLFYFYHHGRNLVPPSQTNFPQLNKVTLLEHTLGYLVLIK